MHFGGNPFEHFAGMGGMPGGMRGASSPPDTMEYYNLLGISREADDKEIKKAFRKKAMKEHPDRGGDAEKFKKISEAYEVLIDSEKRELYNQYGKEGVEHVGRGGGGGGHPAEDILGSIFGNRRPSGPKKGEAIVKALEVSLADLYNGRTFKKKFERKLFEKKLDKPLKCQHCNGQGRIKKMRQIGPGMLQQFEVPCEHCDGHGYNVDVKMEKKELEVQVEKGMKHDQKIKFKGKGHHVPEGEAGDVVYVVQVKEHPVFERKGPHLFMKKTIVLKDALCGVEVVVEHLDGRFLVIKTGEKEVIKPDMMKIVEGEGMPLRGNPYQKGNLIIQFSIEFPDTGYFDEAKKQILKEVLPASENLSGPPGAEEYIMTEFNEEAAKADYMANQEAYESDNEDEGFERGQGGRQGVQCAQS